MCGQSPSVFSYPITFAAPEVPPSGRPLVPNPGSNNGTCGNSPAANTALRLIFIPQHRSRPGPRKPGKGRDGPPGSSGIDPRESYWRVMLRQFRENYPPYPYSPGDGKPSWLPRLEEAHADDTLHGLVCPHRGRVPGGYGPRPGGLRDLPAQPVTGLGRAPAGTWCQGNYARSRRAFTQGNEPYPVQHDGARS